MKTLLCAVVLLSGSLLAQQQPPPTLTLTLPGSVTAGQSVNATVSISSSAGVAALQWTVVLPGGASLGTPVLSAAYTTAGFVIQCGSPLAAGVICLALNPSAAAAAATDGVIATLPILFPAATAPGPISIPLAGVIAASVTGDSIPSSVGSPASIKVLSRCDVNQDGVTNVADIQLLVNVVINGSACPISGTTCSVVTVQTLINAALGKGCKL